MVSFPPRHSARPIQYAMQHLAVCLLSSALHEPLHVAHRGFECAVQGRFLSRGWQRAYHLSAWGILLPTSAAQDGSPGTTTRHRLELSSHHKANARAIPNSSLVRWPRVSQSSAPINSEGAVVALIVISAPLWPCNH